MTKTVTVVTPTGDRAEALQRCQYYLERQTVKPSVWLVIDDGLDTYKPGYKDLVYLTAPPEPDKHTLARNIRLATYHMETDYIIIMEDDDWYSDTYLENMIRGLEKYDLYGEGHAWYYNIEHKCYMNNLNATHASFCQTGFRRNMVKLLRAVTSKESWDVDLRFWRAAGTTKHVHYSTDEAPWAVGIKGMPGRRGTTGGWQKGMRHYNLDPDFKYLRRLIGDADAEYYISLKECVYGP